MNKKTIALLIVSAFALTACIPGLPGSNSGPEEDPSMDAQNQSLEDEKTQTEKDNAAMEANENSANVEAAVTVTVTNNGFTPADVTVKKGQAVKWVNNGDASVWVASAFHPTHEVYPEFDQLRGMGKGESYTFKFDKVGAWAYHDHLNASHFGKVTVTE